MRKSGRTLFDMKKILVGISGASGAPIAIRLLKRLREMADASRAGKGTCRCGV